MRNTSSGAVFRLHDAVVPGLFARHLFHRDHATGALGIEHIRHAADGARDGVQAQNGIAQRHQERLFAGEVFAAQDGVAQALLQPLARVEEVRLRALRNRAP